MSDDVPGFWDRFRPPRTAAAERAAAIKMDQDRADVRATFGHEAGQRVLARLAEAFHVHEPSTTAQSPDGRVDPYRTIHREGRRSAYVHIAALVADAQTAEPPASGQAVLIGDEQEGAPV